MNYIKLVNFELSRFIKIYAVLMGITIISQITGVIVKASQYMREVNQAVYDNLIPRSEFLQSSGPMSMMHVTHSLWFIGPIGLCIAALLFYIFFIWYRDWFGKNTFVYRLLMLPTARLNIFWSKFTALMLMVFGLVALQLVLLPVENLILKLIVPKDFRFDMTVSQAIDTSYYINVLIPQNFVDFLLNYGMGIMAVCILFTAILLERSFRIKGVIMAVIYGVLCVLLFSSPILITELMLDMSGYLYPVELFIIETLLGIVITVVSICVSNFLIKKKVTV